MDRSRLIRRSALACALVALPWMGAAAQTTPGSPPATKQASAADSAGLAREQRLLLQYRALSRVAHERLEEALLLPRSEDERGRALLIEAERYARSAVDLIPDSAHAYFLVAAALGLRSDHESARQRVRMAGEVHAAAQSALEREPEHAGAHHVMGRLHLEAMRVSGMARLIATHLFGSTMMRRASWEQAESHLRKAAELQPGQMVHRLWLARLHIARDEEDDARRELEAVLSAESGSELDRLWQREAAEELEEL